MLLKFLLAATVSCCLLSLCCGQVTSEGCGITKRCFRNPSKCNPADMGCHFISWKKSADGDFEFEMSGGRGNGDQYIAFALGVHDAMELADLYYCDGKQVRSGAIQKLHTPPVYLKMDEGLRTVSASTENGVGQCVLSRPASVTKYITDTSTKDFDITKEKFFLLAAVGDMDGQQIAKHTWRNSTTTAVDFSMQTTPAEVTDDNCGVSKNCYKDPMNCDITDSGCRYFSWSKGEEEGTYEFEMSGGTGEGQQYIAMALGLTDKMQDADLYYCDGTTVRTGAIQKLHSPPASSEMTGGLKTKSASTINGVAKCAFIRPTSVTKTISDGESHDFDVTKEEYHLLGAVGPMNGSNVAYHEVWRNVTEYTINFSSHNKQIAAEEGCGKTKQCFTSPPNCKIGAENCYSFSWKRISDGSYDFEMQGGDGSDRSYLAMALGRIDAMQDADLYFCDGHAVSSAVIRKLHEPPTYLTKNKNIKTLSASIANGMVHCVFNRPASVTKDVTDGVAEKFDLSHENFYLLAAAGRLDGIRLQKHSWATVTGEKIVPMPDRKVNLPDFQILEIQEI